MERCAHCGTGFAAHSADDRYCCRGCEAVAILISEQGLNQFYELKKGLTLAPVRSRPFEEHDFSWLEKKVLDAERRAASRHECARLELRLEGVSCVGCVWLVEKLFARHPGGVRAAANPPNGHLHLEWVPGQCEIEPFLRELCHFGYVAVPVGRAGAGTERRGLAARLGLCGAFALNTMGFSLPAYLGMPADFEFAGLFQLVAFLSATLSMLVGGGYFIDRAWQALRARTLHIDLPISLGLISAYIGSVAGWIIASKPLMYFDFVSIFVFLMLGGRQLQSAAVDRNRCRLVRQQPVPDCVPQAANPEKSFARDELMPGHQFLLGPGQALPVSGLLAAGEADFSLEWIHGEADPQRFSAGARLPAGAILLSRSPAVIEADETWEGSLLEKLTAPMGSERAAPGLDALLRVYLVVVLALGVSALVFWALLGQGLTGVQAMISVFVVSCPCALGVAIPLADDLAAKGMERLGVFVRSATLWPRLRHVRQVIFDKTGTLTLERPALENPESIAQLDDTEALALAQMTRGSLHPMSRSLLETLGNRGQKLLAQHGPGTPHELPGTGVTLSTHRGLWSLGKVGGSSLEKPAPTHENTASELRLDGHLRASFHFRESLRPGTLTMLRLLERRGLSLHLLSGDHPTKVNAMAHTLGLAAGQALGGLSPVDKATRVRALNRHDTLYVGDGANDSLAFDAALVTGTPVVDRSLLESKADFFMLGSGLEFLPRLLDTARTRAHAVHAVFGFSLLYNVGVVAFSMAGRMSPLAAAILMPLSSIICLLLVATIFRRKSPNNG
jgi:Cu2+-exporting ATPase